MSKKAVVIDRVPVYRSLQRELKKRIHGGEWAKGGLIPSRRALADEFAVSVPTVQKAISDMVSEGLLRVNAKRGTYVFGDPTPEPSEVFEFAPISKSPTPVAVAQGPVALVGDIRPNEGFGFAHGWSFVTVNEAELALSQMGIASRFFNRFAADPTLGSAGAHIESRQNTKTDAELIKAIAECRPAAVVLHESVLHPGQRSLIDEAIDAGLFTVAIGSRSFGPKCVSVSYDLENAGFQAGSHLIETGCRRILFFSAGQTDWVQSRLAGVRSAIFTTRPGSVELVEAIGDHALEEVIRTSRDSHPHVAVSYDFAKKILRSAPDVDGVVAVNDDAAFGFVQAASEIGLRMGIDYSIIGFDDSAESHALGLSTLHPPCVGMGREAAYVVAKRLQGQEDFGAIVLRSRLVVRASSAHRN